MMLAKRTNFVAVCGMALIGSWTAQTASAGLIARFLPVRSVSSQKQAAAPPVITSTPEVTLDQTSTMAEEIPAPASSSTCQPCIHYHHKGPRLCCGDCRPDVPTVLKVKHPCVCCEVDVPVCVPACCTGEPTVCCTTGFLGRPVVEYEWCCGYSVRVAFRHCGDLLVNTWGR